MTKFHHAMRSWSKVYKDRKELPALPDAIGFKVYYDEEEYETDRAGATRRPVGTTTDAPVDDNQTGRNRRHPSGEFTGRSRA